MTDVAATGPFSATDPLSALPLEVFIRILGCLTNYEARPCASVSRSWRDACRKVSRAGGFKQNIAVVCSKTNVCHIIDPADRCRVVDSFEILPPCDRMPPNPRSPDGEEQMPWPTAVKFFPTGEALLSQYQTPGLLYFAYDVVTQRFSCKHFEPNPTLICPEGIALGPGGAIYVACAKTPGDDPRFWVYRLDSKGAIRQSVSVGDCNRGTGGVPWSVEIGPDGSLFVTLHWSTEGSEEEGEQGPGDIEEDLEDYVVPTLKPVLDGDAAPSRELLNTGSIFRLKTGRNGVLRGSRRAFCGTNKLNRPAGISFGPDGSVYTTTFASADGRRRIVKFLGAGAGGAAGRFCPDFVCPREEEDFHPWDIVATTQGTAWAVSHGSAKTIEGVLDRGELAEFSLLDGSLLRRFALPEFVDAEPNAITLTPASLNL